MRQRFAFFLSVMALCLNKRLLCRALAATRSYDLVVIGGGSAGLTAAKFAATFGKSVVIVEKNRLGGDCTWTGCVPSKSLIASAKAAHMARNGAKYGVTTGDVRVDMAAVRDRVRSNMERIYKEDDSPDAMAKLGIDTLIGSARFTSPKTLMVTAHGTDDLQVNAKEGVVVATGAKPRRPTNTIKGLDSVKYITYEEVFDLDVLPAKMTVVGGGPIGTELAQAFSRLGSKVTQVATRLIPNEEAEVSEALEKVFEAEGITIVRGTVTAVQELGTNGGHSATCSMVDGTETTVSGDVLLVAVGRIPNVRGMGLEELGVRFNAKGGFDVTNKLATAVNGIYAAGDCTGDRQFTHYAGYQGAVAARNVLLPLTDPGVMEHVPATTFTSPEVASIGLTEKAAKELHGEDDVAIAIQHLDHVDRAICDGAEVGLIKIVYKKKNYQILGATIMSPAAGEIISEISVAIKTKLTLEKLATVIHPYPAYSFALMAMAGDLYYEKTLRSKGLYDFLKKLGL